MKIDRQKCFRLSRDPRFLLRTALIIAGISMIVGLVISLATGRSQGSYFTSKPLELSDLEELDQHVDLGELDTAKLAQWIRDPDQFSAHLMFRQGLPITEFGDPLDVVDFEEELSEAVLPFLEDSISRAEEIDPSERKLLLDLFHGLHGKGRIADEAFEGLKSAAATEPPRRYASEFLADIFAHRDEIDAAIDGYRLEIARFEESARYSRLRIVELLRQEDREEELRELFQQPEFLEILPPGERIRVARDLRDWPALFRAIVAYDFRVGNFALFFLSLFAGGIWFVIVTQFSGYGRSRILLYLAAVILGWFSATATLFVIQIQELRGFTHDYEDPFVQQLVYCVAGIGLREETMKLLFFIPLVPFLLRRRSEIEALICAGLVGLGFAMNENSSYVENFGAFTAWSRFLTANFLHIAMSGVIGLAFYSMCRWPRRQWDNFLYDFLIVVAIHGAYDALQMVPELQGYAILALVVYALTAYLFLDKAASLMGASSSHTVSPLAVFVVGSALLMGVILCYASWGAPFYGAFADYIGSLSGMIPIAFVFVNRLRNH